MKRHLFTLMAALAISLGVLGVAPSSVEAANDCNVAYVRYYQYDNQGGKSYKFCYSQGDADMGTALANSMGPLYDWSYQRDPCYISSNSCVTSFSYWDGTADPNLNLCLYWQKNYDKTPYGYVYVHTTGNYNMPSIELGFDQVMSFRWTTGPNTSC